MEKINEISPTGWGGTTSAMMKHHKKKIDNPWALAYWMKKRDFKSHYKNDPEGTKSKKEPEKKDKYKDEDKSKKLKFKEWLELDEVAKFYYNQQTYDKWIPELLDKAIDKAMDIAARNPDTNWMRYNLPYWQQNREELIKRLEPMTQQIFDYEPGIQYNSLITRMVIAIGQIFQKEPYTRRHIAYANSLGKHPDEIEKRKRGRQVGYRKPITPST